MCAQEKLPIELKFTVPPKHTRSPEFKQLNPRMKIPVLQEDDFVLAEGAAIACYLADTNGMDALYPKDPHRRARIHEALSWNSAELRPASTGVCVPALRSDIKISEKGKEKLSKDLGAKCAVFEAILEAHGGFTASDEPTLADFFTYSELGQLRPGMFDENPRTGEKLWDFSPYPGITRWLDNMSALPEHDAMHQPVIDYAAHLKSAATK